MQERGRGESPSDPWPGPSSAAGLDEVAILGGGPAAAGLGRALLSAGLRVVLIEAEAEALERAGHDIARGLPKGLPHGRLRLTGDLADAARAGAVFDTTTDDIGASKGALSSLQAILPEGAVLATLMPAPDLDDIAAALPDPARLVGLHLPADAEAAGLVEAIAASATSQEALARALGLVRRLGRIGVTSRAGGIAHRLLTRFHEAADTLLMDGTNPWELDEAMVDFGFAMGPYEAQDITGLDMAHAERRRRAAARDPARRYIPISDRMVEEGRLGRKVGVGWYRYPGGGGKVVDPLVEDLAREEAWFARVERRAFTNAEIRRRLLLALINEGLHILHEGAAATAADIDLVCVRALGFPPSLGGPLHYALQIGEREVLGGLKALQGEDPVAWRPAPWFAPPGRAEEAASVSTECGCRAKSPDPRA